MLFLCWTLNVKGKQERSVLLSCSFYLNARKNNKHYFVHYVKLDVNMHYLTNSGEYYFFFYFALPTANTYQAWLCVNNNTGDFIENIGIRKCCRVWVTWDCIAKSFSGSFWMNGHLTLSESSMETCVPWQKVLDIGFCPKCLHWENIPGFNYPTMFIY